MLLLPRAFAQSAGSASLPPTKSTPTPAPPPPTPVPPAVRAPPPVVQSGATPPSNADSYARAAQAYRDAAAKCPGRAACYNAFASYQECLGRGASCVAPNCSQATPCGGATAGGATNSGGGSSSSTAFPSVQQSFDNLGNTINGIFQDRERRDQERAAEEQRANEQAAQFDADRMASEDAERARRAAESVGAESEEDDRAREREKRRRTAIASGATTPPPAPAPAAPNSTTPAFPSVGASGGEWTPWYSLNGPNGLPLLDLDIAYWFGTAQESTFAIDYPTQWVIRNRSGRNLRIDYKLTISCNQECVSGNFLYTIQVPAGQHRTGGSKHLYQILGAQVLSSDPIP